MKQTLNTLIEGFFKKYKTEPKSNWLKIKEDVLDQINKFETSTDEIAAPDLFRISSFKRKIKKSQNYEELMITISEFYIV
jgi:hypothetical protein